MLIIGAHELQCSQSRHDPRIKRAYILAYDTNVWEHAFAKFELIPSITVTTNNTFS